MRTIDQALTARAEAKQRSADIADAVQTLAQLIDSGTADAESLAMARGTLTYSLLLDVAAGLDTTAACYRPMVGGTATAGRNGAHVTMAEAVQDASAIVRALADLAAVGCTARIAPVGADGKAPLDRCVFDVDTAHANATHSAEHLRNIADRIDARGDNSTTARIVAQGRGALADALDACRRTLLRAAGVL